MQSKMIDYCAVNGLIYVDYFIMRSGKIAFCGRTKKGKEVWYIVERVNPFCAVPYTVGSKYLHNLTK